MPSTCLRGVLKRQFRSASGGHEPPVSIALQPPRNARELFGPDECPSYFSFQKNLTPPLGCGGTGRMPEIPHPPRVRGAAIPPRGKTTLFNVRSITCSPDCFARRVPRLGAAPVRRDSRWRHSRGAPCRPP